MRFRNLLSEYTGDKIVILSTHIVSDIEAIAVEVLLMKKGKFILQGTVPELTEKAKGKVWELIVPAKEARKWQTKTTVANFRHEGKEVVLRIISLQRKYGFILRYPVGKQEITGTSYEPWHYRYVGIEAAQEIYELGICLEEYSFGTNRIR